jgi:glutamate synthase (NADPH/NADH) small chain
MEPASRPHNKYRPVAERLEDFRPVEKRAAPEELRDGLRRCQDCGIPFCHAVGCPLGNAIPEMNLHALAGRWERALATLLATSPFPEFTARVCPALCEGSCVQGMHEEPTPIRQTEKEIIERGFASGWIKPLIPERRLGLKVAVVGAGPSGLATAWRLSRAGAQVTLYESAAKPGGFLRYGIPDFKLEKEVLDRRMELMAEEGVKFECGVDVGLDIGARLLKKRFDAVVLAVGSRKKRDLVVPGRELAGIHFATDYLSAQNRLLGGEIKVLPPGFSARGRRAVVVGGGDTGSDCLGTALRQGAKSVAQFEIMPDPPPTRTPANPWPEWPRIHRDSSSHEEGGERRWNITTLEFLPGDVPGRLGALRCAEVEWLAKDGGRPAPVPRPGTEFIQPAEMAMLAMGFTGVEDNILYRELGVALTPAGLLARNPDQSVADGVFAAGDAAKGPSLVVRAMADGLETAKAVLAWHAAGGAKKEKAGVSPRLASV